MPVVTQTMYVGILRSANSQESAVDENIKKARLSIYGLITPLHLRIDGRGSTRRKWARP